MAKPISRLIRRVGAIAAVSALLLVASATGVPAQDLPPGGTFLDDDWGFAEGAIEAVAAAGITNGCGRELYCPDRSLSRAETAALVFRIVEPPSSPEGVFPDVPANAWYSESVHSLAATGIITGHLDGTFRPLDGLSRADMAHLLMRAFPELPEKVASVEFADVPNDAGYAVAVDWLATRGITNGCSTTPLRYCPSNVVRRDEMAVFLARAMGLEMRVPPKRTAPLNGFPIKGLDWDRRVVAIKIDDHRGGRPQSGVDQADAVMETLVEGDLTRWTALYHQSDTGIVGPVRSLRPTDIDMLLPLGGTVAISGAQPWIVDMAVAAGINVLRERDARPALYRITQRRAPHNLYGDTRKLREVATEVGFPDEPPPPLLEWGALPPGVTATHISLEWSDPVTVSWIWDGSRYLRWREGAPHPWLLPDGSVGQVSADSLIVIVAPVSEMAPPPGVSGSPVPFLDTVGTGTAYVFAEGRRVQGVWSRATDGEPLRLTTLQGGPLTIPPGVPWINVFPLGRDISS